jgi:hypothetical protein
MIIYIPKAIGQKTLYKTVSRHEVREIATLGVIDSNRVRTPRKIAAMNRSRNACVTDYLNIQSKPNFVCMQDRDCIHIDDNALQLAIDYLTKNPQYGAVALPWKNEHFDHEHVRCLCVVFRSEVFSQLTFRATVDQCTCIGLKEDIEAMGYQYDYLPYHCKLVAETL